MTIVVLGLPLAIGEAEDLPRSFTGSEFLLHFIQSCLNRRENSGMLGYIEKRGKRCTVAAHDPGFRFLQCFDVFNQTH